MLNLEHVVWSEKYRPTNVKECILPKNTKNIALGFVKQGNIPNLLLSGPAGTGKAQPLSAKVLTPNGWTSIGNLKIGDDVLTPKGTITKVIGVYPQGKKDIFKLTFSDGASTHACAEHLWECYVPSSKGKKYSKTKTILNTADIIDFLKQKLYSDIGNISIDLITPYDGKEISLPLNPYLLGVLIGDGHLVNTPSITSVDTELLDKCQNILSEYMVSFSENDTGISHRIVQDSPINYGGAAGISKNPITKILSDIELLYKKSHEKFIPDVYKQSSIKQKLELIRGLMDTDGYVDAHGITSYTTTSIRLANDIREIIWSLGGKCSISTKTPTYNYKGIKKTGRLAYTLNISYKHPKELFSLSRKKEKCKDLCDVNQFKRIIKKVEYTNTTDAVCIMVEDNDHLYITDDYIITHNTTLAKALCSELGYEVMVINGSNEGRLIDTLRTKITQFASTYSFDGCRKCVIIDEADYLTMESVQPALRNFIDEFTINCTFILTCNFPNRLMEPIHSRCTNIDFTIPNDETQSLVKEMFVRTASILDENNVDYDKVALGKIIKKTFPDFRKCLGTVQRLSATGKIDVETLNALEAGGIDDLIGFLKEKDFTGMRKWVASTPNLEMTSLCRKIYDKANTFIINDSLPQLVLHLADYQYKDNFVADKEINVVALLTQIMMDCETK